MKRFFTIAAIMAAFATLAGCEPTPTPDDENPPVNKTIRLNAYTEKQTRTTMGSDYSVLWSEGDRIMVMGYSETTNGVVTVFSLVEGAGTTEGKFEGKIADGFDTFYAFYPTTAGNTAHANGTFTVKLPGTNAIYAEQNFIDGANPMVAVGTERSGLQFKNVCGILELKIAGKGTISSLTLEVGELDGCISGDFTVNPVTQSITAGENASRTIAATLQKPIELSDIPRSIYAILPPGVYSSVKLSTTDTDGKTVAHTANNAITVKRSHITPVSDFRHEVVEETMPVVLQHLEPQSNCIVTAIAVGVNEPYKKAAIMLFTEEEYQRHLAAGYSDATIIGAQNVSVNTLASGLYNFNTYRNIGGNWVMIALPLNENNQASLKPTKLTFKAKDVPEDAAVTAAIGNQKLTSTSFSADITATPATGKIMNVLLTKKEYEEATPSMLKYWSVGSGSRDCENGKISVVYDILLPETTYVLLYRSANGQSDNVLEWTYTAYSALQTYEFTTPAHDYSNATVSLSTVAVRDWSADIAISTSGASKYKLYITPNATDEGVNVAPIVEEFGVEYPTSHTSHTFTTLKEATTYYVFALPYDSTGKAGRLAELTFTTNAEILPEPSSEYDKFLGTYTFSSKNGARGDEPRDVVISKEVDGKVFRISGLMHPTMASQIPDASVFAHFKNGQIRILFGKVADYGQYTPVWCAPYKDGLFLMMVDLCGTYNNGRIEFMDAQNNGLTGLFFYQSSAVDGSYQGGGIDYYDDLVLTKKSGGSEPPVNKSNTTENFTRSEEVAAGWK